MSEIPCRVNDSSFLVGENSPECCGNTAHVNRLITVNPEPKTWQYRGKLRGQRGPVTTDPKGEAYRKVGNTPALPKNKIHGDYSLVYNWSG